MKFSHSPQHNNVSQEKPLEKPKGTLPVDIRRVEIMEQLHGNETVIVVGETGSGKTTRIPIFLLEEFPDKKIIITSPRVLPARSVSRYVAQTRGGRVGGEVGLLTRENKEVSQETKAIFMTDGVLLSMLRKDPMLLEQDVVMVDEAHERTINIDLALGLLKQAQKLRKENGEPELKIIVTSATIEEQKFADYFDQSPVAKVEGRMYPVDVVYSPINENDDFTKEAGNIVKTILNTTSTGDILVFMPGEEEIKKTIETIETMVPQEEVLVLPLYGAMNPQDQDTIFSKSPKRKVIVSTNIAETSVTIDGITHVVDSGYVKQKNYNPITGINALEITSCSQASMNQRKGRAGRTAPGTCYRMTGEQEFKRREEFQKPEILRSDLGEVVLRMKEMDIKDVEGFDFIDKPPRASIHDAITSLKALGALDQEGDITDIGKEMVRLELRPDLSRMLIEAKHLGCLNDMVDLCSMLSASKQVLIKPKKGDTIDEQIAISKQEANQDKLKVIGSDPLTMLTVWDKWSESGNSRSFAYEHLLNVKALNEIGLTRAQLLKTLAQGGIEVTERKNKVDAIGILKCLFAGAPNGLFYTQSFGKSYDPVADEPYLKGTRVFPGSSSFSSRSTLLFAMNIQKSEKIVEDRMFGGKTKLSTLYARMCQKVTLDELKQIIPHLIVEKKYGDPVLQHNGIVSQQYHVYINGKLVTTRTEELDAESITLEQRYGSFERAMDTVLYGISTKNRQVLKEYEDLQMCSLDRLPKLDLDDVYREIFEKQNIKTKEDIEEHADDLFIKLSSLVSSEEIERIEKDFPKEITVQGRSYVVTYPKRSYYSNKLLAVVHLNTKEDVDLVIENESSVPDFPYVDGVVFKYGYRDDHSIEGLRTQREFEKRLEKQARERQSYNDTYRPSYPTNGGLYHQDIPKAPSTTTLGDLLKSKLNEEKKKEDTSVEGKSVSISEIKKVEKQILTEEKKEEYVKTIVDIKNILRYLKGVIDKTDHRVLKDKDKILKRIKEFNADCGALGRTLEVNSSVITLTIEATSGKVNEFLQTLKTIIKNTGIYSKGKEANILGVYQHNKKALDDGFLRNEVIPDENLTTKALVKAVTLAFEKDAPLSDEEVDGIIIELI